MREVVIIGAGPAGSTAAILLARHGWAVTLVEQHRFPRDKVCGECLSALAVEVISRLGLLQTLRTAGAVELNRALLHSPNSSSADIPLPRTMLGISRAALDGLLLDSARAAGAAVRQPTRCEAIEPMPDGARLRLRDLSSNGVTEVIAGHVILADGKSALPGPTPDPTGDFGIKSHWMDINGPRNAIELFGCAGCYGGLAPIEGDHWNTAFSVPAARLRRHHGNVESVFAELTTENPMLACRLRGARRVLPWLASPLPRFAVRKGWPRRVVPVGNAAAALEPIGGEGMGLAMRSAELAADALNGTSDNSEPCEPNLRGMYGRLWRVRRTACRAGAMIASSPTLAPIILPLLARHPSMTRAALRGIGK